MRKAVYGALSRRSSAGHLLRGGAVDEQPPVRAASHIRLRPTPKNDAELSDLAARVNWYLPDLDVPIVVDAPPSARVSPDLAPWMEPEYVTDPGWLHAPPAGAGHDLVHRLGLRGVGRILGRGRATTVADPSLYYVADLGWIWLRWHFASMSGKTSQKAVEKLFALRKPGAESFVLATGPSAKLVDPSSVTADVRISCNSVVRDRELIRALRPNVICFADAVFHYGPSRYAAAFRRDLLRAVDDTDALLVTFDLWGGLLLAHFPELKDRLVLMHPSKVWDSWLWPTPDRLAVRQTGNVLTNSMLPLAVALTDHVSIAGCDGRSSADTYFWQHNKRTQYSDELMQGAQQAHPAFFRDQDYSDYYDTHCAELEGILQAAEAAGKRVHGVTPSHIPALLRRGAPAF